MFSRLDHDIINWQDETHQRIVAATLVEGAYAIEKSLHHGKDMQSIEMAKASVASLGFQTLENIKSEISGSYLGTIYKYDPQNVHPPKSMSPPNFVIAFRGTMGDPETLVEDVISDFQFVFHSLQWTTRCANALEAVEHIISISGGSENVWLAGHSLGSAIALAIARDMVIKKSIHIKSFLFNPPFPAYGTHKPFNYIYFLGRSFLTAGLDYVSNMTHEERDEVFNKIGSWSPYLFVNKRDELSSGYRLYFRQRKIMSKVGLGKIENRATQGSVMSVGGKIMGKLGKTLDIDFEPTHLIPNAYLIITKSSRWDPLKAHSLAQWLDEKLVVKKKTYEFKKRR